MGYPAFPPVSWNDGGAYFELSTLKPVEDLTIKEKFESKYLSPLMPYESVKRPPRMERLTKYVQC